MHPRDGRVRMLARPRCVLVDERPLHFAATQLVKEFAEEFDAKATIRKMMSGPSWPTLGYAVGARKAVGASEDLDPSLPTQVVREGKVQQVLPAGVEASSHLYGEDASRIQFERAMTEAEILSSWDAKGDKARTAGIAAHERIEACFASCFASRFPSKEAPSPLTPEGMAYSFAQEHLSPLGGEVVATEWCIFDEDASVVASVDAVARFQDGSVGLIDWKHTVGLGSRTSSPRRLLPPLSHLPDCDVVRYALQLSVYARIVERKYGWTIRCLCLVNTHTDDDFFTDLPYLRNEAEFLLEHCHSKMQSRPDAEPKCAVDGVLAMDPVRCADGQVRCKKYAHAMGQRYRMHMWDEARRKLKDAFRPTRREQVLVGALRRGVDWDAVFPLKGVQALSLDFRNFEAW